MADLKNSRNTQLNTSTVRLVSNQKAVSVTSPDLLVNYDSTGTLVPSQTLEITAVKSNTVAPIVWSTSNSAVKVYDATTGTTEVTSDASTSGTSTVYLRASEFNAAALSSLTVTATVTDIDVVSGYVTFIKLQASPGSSTFTASLYLQNASYPAGTPPTAPVGGTFNFSTGVLTAPTGTPQWTATQPATSTTPTWACEYNFTGTVTQTVTAGTWQNVRIDTVTGAAGTRTAILDLYRWSSTVPTTFPSGTSTYTWSTAQFAEKAGTSFVYNSWTTVPGTPVLGQTLYILRQVYADTGSSLTSDVAWSTTTPLPIAVSGTNGTRTGVLEVYKWATTQPTSSFPTGTSTYTWATGVFTLPATPNGWSLLPGASVAGSTLWAVQVTIANTSTSSTNTVTWPATPTAYAVGAAGIGGTSQNRVELYWQTATAPAIPTFTRYTFSTDTVSIIPSSGGSLGSWQRTPPDSTTTATWMTSCQFSVVAPGDVHDSSAWSTPVVYAQKGANGAPGTNGKKAIGVNAFLWSTSVPTIPTLGVTYTWSSNSVSAYPAVTPATTPATYWTGSAPAAPGTGYTLYMMTASLSNVDAADATTDFNWSSATLNTIGYRQDGTIGPQGNSYRIAYIVTTNPALPTKPADTTGSTSVPAGTIVYDGVTSSWSATATSNLTAGQYMYQTDGIYNPTTGTVVWGNPYLSNLKVGTLSAITANVGNLTVATGGNIKTSGKNYGDAEGFFIGFDGTTNKFSIGDKLLYNGTTFSLPGITIGSTGAINGIGTGAGTVVDVKYAEFQPILSWDFTNSNQSWTAAGGTLTPTATYSSISSTGADPVLLSPTISVPGYLYTIIRARVRRTAGTAFDGNCFYSTSGHTYSAYYYKTAANTTILNEWVILEWDMSSLSVGGSDWTASTITGIRLDLGNSAADAFDVDWVQIGRVSPLPSQSSYFNNAVSINADGSLVGAGGGQVTIRGVGYNGDLNATGGNFLNTDPSCTDLTRWLGSTSSFTVETVTDAPAGTKVFRTSQTSPSIWSNLTPVDALKTYKVRALVRKSSTSDTSVIYLAVALFDAAGAMISRDGNMWYYPVSGIQPTTGWLEYSGTAGFDTANTIPANAKFIAVGIFLHYGGTVGYHEAQGISLEDITAAAAAQTTANTAASAASTAQSDATSALGKITDISSDSLLTPDEKPQIIQDYDVIIAEKTGINAQATNYSVTTENTAYNTAVTDLTNYLATLTSPVLWSTLSGNTTIVGTTFRTKFKDVYTARQALLDKIAASAKTLADAAQTTANAQSTTTLVGRGVTVNGNTLTKTGGTNNTWDADVYSQDSFVGGAYASVKVTSTTTNIMFGLNSDPTTNTSYSSIDYAIYLNGDGNLYEYNGPTQGQYLGTRVVGDILAVTYDGVAVRYLKNGTVIGTPVTVNITANLFFDSSFYQTGSSLTNVQFGPLTSIGGIKVNADGSLSGAGGGQVTVSGLGYRVYRIISKGGSATTNPTVNSAVGLFVDGVAENGGSRSYSLTVIRRSDGVIVSNTNYDVYGSATNATNLADALNALTSDYIVVVFTQDEPLTNRLTSGLPAALYRCGASRAVFGSSEFKFRSAYALVGIAGCGEGNGAEFYQGVTDSSVNAWIDATFSVVKGSLTGVSGSYTPSSIKDYGYIGDLDATKGAPTGTVVGSILAENVESATGAQAKANTAQSNAISTAAGDATTKADAAQAAAIAAAATDATNKAAAKLNKSAADTLTGPILISTTGGIVSGNLTWDSTGARTGGKGVAITPKGIVGHNGTIPTFAIDATTGDATFSGALSAATGNFTGAVYGGSYTNSYAWPAAGGTGFYLGASGLLFGTANGTNAKYFQIEGTGNVYAPGFSIVNGSASFSGTLASAIVNTDQIVGGAASVASTASSSGATVSVTVTVPTNASAVLLDYYLGPPTQTAYTTSTGSGKDSSFASGYVNGPILDSLKDNTAACSSIIISPSTGTHTYTVTRSYYTGTMRLSVLILKR